ncbi:hypothetical protein M3B46_05070 [Sphingobacterium daejeonense]|uniref:SusC/RagA family TonB-linked outer membrane protein n=1 Tax=Sphingobacterium daejeonense TaxID=371142 RepID=UPI0021A7B3FB|nr:SusC/RagA family TonB-linked outer membrane protein [Sphingobacterium daejeonense]MCT1530354.1 hypothetical protein [Sphingobacterium daejeonense]
MKIALTVLISMLLFVSAKAQKVTLKEKDASLESVLMKIKDQTNYDVFYSGNLINRTNPVTINVKKKELLLVLNDIFRKQPISYSIANQTIVLVPKTRDQKVDRQPEGVQIIITDLPDPLVPGVIVNQLGEPMAGVTIINLKDSVHRKSASDKNGRFTIAATRGDLLAFRSQGHKENLLFFRGEQSLKVQMFEKVLEMEGITIESKVKEKLNLNTQIDLTNRSYMNLGQVLQGTVPGLTLQILPSNRKKVIGVNIPTTHGGLKMTYYTVEQYLQYDPRLGQRVIEALEKGQRLPLGSGIVLPVFSTQSSVTLVPELRGSASFGNTEGMMIVIDGFPIEEFPADYPMANVESVQVIKDPKELIKWGPRAMAGIILIKTKDGKFNKLRISYSTNMYYRPKPKYNFNDLGLATSADLVDLYQEISNTELATGDPFAESTDISILLLNRLHSQIITRDQFNKSMDSLAVLSNENQINLLQQNSFSMNHLLNLSGGSTHYRFALTGNYSKNQSNGLQNNADSYGLDLKNNFSLFNNKLKIQWQINGTHNRSQDGSGELSVYNMPRPYQMLLDQNGGYVYDYSSITAERNALIEKAGYLNNGVNLLEDFRSNGSFSTGTQIQTRFDSDWELLKGLRWANSVFFRRLQTNTTGTIAGNSSAARQLINNMGVPKANGVDFYLPLGDIVNKDSRLNQQLNVRTGLSLTKQIDDHTISMNVGAGGSSDIFQLPSSRKMYGYNHKTGYGLPIFVPANPDQGIYSYRSLYQTTSSPYYMNSLLTPSSGDSTMNRNLNANAGIHYAWKDSILTVNANASEIYAPNYGMANYSKTQMYSGELGWKIRTSIFPSWLNSLRVATGITNSKLPDLQKPINGTRKIQEDWNNYAIWISNYLPIQQAGQSSRNIYQKVSLKLFSNQLTLIGTYNTQTMAGISRAGSLNDSTAFGNKYTVRYFGVAADGIFRDGALMFTLNYDRSPEGSKQFNGNLAYDIKNESYFTSEKISSFLIGASYQTTSAFQGLSLMMGTNSMQGGGFSMATNNNFGLLPPNNRTIEAFIQMGFNNDKTRIDLRYYNRSDMGLSNNVPLDADPSTGLGNLITYSNIQNRGFEFYVKSELVSKEKFRYTLGINGAYNQNMAVEVPDVPYTADEKFLRGYRNGYSTNSVWAYKWAGLDNQGNPQIYDLSGKPTTTPDSATLSKALIYMGQTRAPWTAGVIQEVSVGNFFGRATVLVNLGGVMKKYIPTPSVLFENSALIADRWRKPGDEAFTDVPALSSDSDRSMRGYLTRNSSNSYFSSDFARLQEILIGWNAPNNLFIDKRLQSLNVSFHIQSLGFWSKNKYHLDPNSVDDQGRRGLPLPVQYGLTLNATF